MNRSPVALVEFPADDTDRARRFWSGVLGVALHSRTNEEGTGWQTREAGPPLGIHGRGPGPGDTRALPYLEVEDMETALEQVRALGGAVIHPGESTAICKDSEGSPFGLLTRNPGAS